MSKITFHTNLDEAKRSILYLNEDWSSPHIPRVGERVELQAHPGKVFHLVVVQVTWSHRGNASVELHLGPEWSNSSIYDWEEWFKRYTRG